MHHRAAGPSGGFPTGPSHGGARLLIQAQTGCTGSNSLLWYNPGTHAEQWLLRAPVNAFGVTAVVPYYTRENAYQY